MDEDELCACRGSPAGHKKLATLRNYMELLRKSAQLSRSPKSGLSVKYKTHRRSNQDRFQSTDFLPVIKEPKKLPKLRNLNVIKSGSQNSMNKSKIAT